MTGLFNLSAENSAYNTTARKRVALDENWGLAALESENLRYLVDAQNLFHRLLQSEVSIEKSRQLTQYYRDATTSKLLMQRIRWEEDIQRHLSKAETWLHWRQEKNAHNEARKKRLLQLQTLWQDSSLLFHSNEALIRIFVFLQAVLAYLSLAQLELNKKLHKLPASLAKKVQHYFNYLTKRFNTTRILVLETMNARLLVANETAGRIGYLSGDLASYSVEHLQQEGISLVRAVMSSYRQPFSKFTFNFFQQALFQHGEAQTQEKVKKLLWRRDSAGFYPSKQVLLNKQWCTVPQEIMAHLPKWQGWPAWLFADRRARIKLLIEHQYEIAQLKIPLVEIPVRLNSQNQLNFLHNLAKQETAAEQILQIWSNKKDPSLSGYNKLVIAMEHFTAKRLNACLQKQIIFLERVSQQIIADDLTACQKQWQILNPLLRNIQKKKLSPIQAQQVSQVQAKLQQQLRQHPTLYVADLLQSVLADDTVNIQQRQLIVEILKALKLGEMTSDSVINASDANIIAEKILRSIKKQAKQAYLTPGFLVDAQLLNLLANAEQQQKLYVVLEKLVLDNFKALLAQPTASAKLTAEKFEKIILTVGCGKMLKEFTALGELRKNADWGSYLDCYQKLAERLALVYTDKQVVRQVTRVENYLTECVSKISGDKAETAVLTKLPARLVEQQSTKLAEIPLRHYEKILAGLKDSGARGAVCAAIEVAAASRLLSQKVLMAQSLAEKERLLDQLNQEIQQRAVPQLFFQKRYPLALLKVSTTTYLESKYHVSTRAAV